MRLWTDARKDGRTDAMLIGTSLEPIGRDKSTTSTALERSAFWDG